MRVGSGMQRGRGRGMMYGTVRYEPWDVLDMGRSCWLLLGTLKLGGVMNRGRSAP